MSSVRTEKKYLVMFEEYVEGGIIFNLHNGKYIFNNKEAAEDFLVEYMERVPIVLKGRLYKLESEYEKSSSIMDITNRVSDD